jgi:hypothetical protein
VDYLQALQVLVIHAEVASLISIQTEEPSVKWKCNDAIKTPVTNLNHPLVRSRYVFASLFIFGVGSFYFDLFPFVHNKKNHVN